MFGKNPNQCGMERTYLFLHFKKLICSFSFLLFFFNFLQFLISLIQSFLYIFVPSQKWRMSWFKIFCSKCRSPHRKKMGPTSLFVATCLHLFWSKQKQCVFFKQNLSFLFIPRLPFGQNLFYRL